MNPLDLKLTVPPDRKLIIQLPEVIESGDETVSTVIVHPTSRPPPPDESLDWFPTLNVSRWDPSISLRREDMYSNDGR